MNFPPLFNLPFNALLSLFNLLATNATLIVYTFNANYAIELDVPLSAHIYHLIM